MKKLFTTLVFLGSLLALPVSASTINKTLSTPSLNSGLQGWWTFDGADQATTVTSTDKSGNGNYAGIVGGVTPVEGKIGQAMQFDGVSGKVSTPVFSFILTNGTYSMSAWYKANKNTGGILNFTNGVSNNDRNGIILNNGAVEAGLYNGTAYSGNSIATTLNKWHHVILTNNAGTLKMYYDGNLVSGGAVANLGVTQNIGWNSNAGYFNGSIDDVRIWNRALSAKEVLQLYQMGGGTVNKTLPNTNTLNKNLQGWWTFDGADQATTVTSTDKSGNGNNAGKNGGTTLTQGKIGQAMSFDGNTGTRVIVASSTSFNLTQQITLSAWVKTQSTSGAIISMDDVSTLRQFSFIVSGSGQAYVYFFQNNITYSNAIGTTINDNKWHNVVATININGDGKARVYVDGNFKNTGNAITSIMSTSRPVYIGNREGSALPLAGSIDDVRIYNRVLSAKEILQLYKMGGGTVNKTLSNTNSLNKGLTGWWTMDGADVNATQVLDKSGKSNTGTRTAVTLVSGKIGQAGSFDGVSSKVDAGNSLSVSTTFAGDYTVSLWEKSNDTATLETLWFKTDIAMGNMGVFFNYPSAGIVEFYSGSGSGVNSLDSTTANLNNGKWRHIVVQLKGTTQNLYVDGFLNASRTKVAGTATNSTFTIGSEQSSRYFKGSIDDVRVWNRALSAKEAMQLYQMGM